MRKYILLIVLNSILVLLQVSFFGELFGANTPSLVLVLGLALILAQHADLGLWSLLFGGVLLDVVQVSTVGFSSFVLVLLSFLLMQTLSRLPDSWVLTYLGVVIVTVIYLAVFNVLSVVSLILTLLFVIVTKLLIQKY